jgi:hypothetical protein
MINRRIEAAISQSQAPTEILARIAKVSKK